MAQIHPTLPVVGQSGWGTVLNTDLTALINESNYQDSRLTTLEHKTIGVPNATATTAGAIVLAGDLTGSSTAPRLATVINAGTAGDATHVPTITWDAKGRVTSVSSTAITGAAYSDSQAKDAAAAALAAGTQSGISFAYDSTAKAISATVPQYTDQQTRDAVNTLLTNGTQTGITFNYNSSAHSLSATVTGTGGASYTDAQAKAAAAAALMNGATSGITYSFDSTNNVINTTVTAGSGSTDPFGPYGVVYLDSFAGASDDAKLTNALATVAADTYPRTIQLTNRAYTFNTVQNAFTGMRIRGPEGYSNPERNSKLTMKITLGTSGPWFTSSATTYGVSLHNLTFVGSSSGAILGGTGNYYCLSMRDIFAAGLSSVLGTQAQPLVVTAANFTGDWEINNSYHGAFHIQGSDNTFWTDGMLLDSATAYNTAGSSNGQYHLWFDQCEKSFIGPVYITCEAGWGGVRVTGNGFNSTSNNQGGPLWFTGARIEGRNAGAPCNGANVSVEGGIVVLRDSWVSYGLANPSSFNSTTPPQGVINHTGGTLLVDGTTYDRASSIAETSPWVYTDSVGDCQVSHALRASKGGTWTGRPRVKIKSGNTENRIADATVTLI